MGVSAFGQQFQYSASTGGDLIAGFRKPGLDNYELVVNLGNVYTNIEILTPGTTVTLNHFTPTQLANAFPTGLGDLQWSVSSAFIPVGSSHGFPGSTLWYTQPRADAAVQSTPPVRFGSGQSTVKQDILGVPSGAFTISGTMSSNINNTIYVVREPVWDQVNPARSDLTFHIGDTQDPSIGDFKNLSVVENTTPSSFTSVSRSDFYRARPTGFADPETGLTDGPAYYLGYFSLNTDGTLSFTRGSSVVTPPAPPKPVLAIQRLGTTNLISFATTNGATYKLYFTNSVGLRTPLTNWPSISTNITGTGGTNSFLDITTDAIRFYGVTVQ
ncbi:MAG TPA: hypothetical protein VG938_04250 [Verrucomicrobiae bacterium]|nr:hypothetical protein [Verrucomicrobiae bacterium]